MLILKRKFFFIWLLLLNLMCVSIDAFAEWAIDLSRRTKSVQAEEKQDFIERKKVNSDMGVMDKLFQSSEPLQEIAILNTEKGFVPATIRFRQGLKYKINIVNVNSKDKNVSFVLDSFGEHHSTYFGKIKTFYLEPKKEGIYSFQCPETSAEGKLIIYANPGATNLRVPASAHESGTD